MKKIETLFELSNYDSKNITNKGTRTISRETLSKIETEGATLELLESLGVPVFKYQTQITIHGLFPTLESNYLGGYKNLFQNKNLSIGVKWQAVDYNKKLTIYNTVRKFASKWHLKHNSTDFQLMLFSEYFETKEAYINHLAAAKAHLATIDKTLFFGNCGVYLCGTLSGRFFLVTYINIGAVKAENIDKVIENICNAPISEINAKIQADKLKAEQDAIETRAQYAKEAAEREEKKKPLLEAARKVLMDAGYILAEKQTIKQGDVFIKIETDTTNGTFKFSANRFTKEARQKKWRRKSVSSETLNFEFDQWNYNLNEYSLETFSGWYKPQTEVKIKETAPEVKDAPKQAINAGNVVMVNYSDKAVAIFGDTKPIKETLKQYGGRFNPYLKRDGIQTPGWIFSKTQETNLRTLINQ